MKRYIKASDEYMRFRIVYPDGSPIEFSDEYLKEYKYALETELQNYADDVATHHFDPLIMESFNVKISAEEADVDVQFSDTVYTYSCGFNFTQLIGVSEDASKNGVNNLQEVAKADAKTIYEKIYKEFWASIKKDLGYE